MFSAEVQQSSGLKLPGLTSSVEQCIRKILQCMVSNHFKVAQYATILLQDRYLLTQFFISNDDDDQVSILVFKSNGITILVICTLFSFLKKISTVASVFSARILETKQTLLDGLVKNLRTNRDGYWHPLVQQVTAATLDLVFECMM